MTHFLPLLTGWGVLNVAVLLVLAVAAFIRRHEPVTLPEEFRTS